MNELEILTVLTGPIASSSAPREPSSPVYLELRTRVLAAMGQLALHHLREHGPVRAPTHDELLQLLGSCDYQVRQVAAHLAVACGRP